jgi:hypothetical protein
LELEAAGVWGNGMSFSPEEKQKAHSVTYNIATNIYGNVERSQVGTAGSANAQHSVAVELDNARLKEIVAALKNSSGKLGLDHQEKCELEAEIQTLAAQTASPKPKVSIIRERLASVRNILEGIAGNLIAAAILRQINF